jgi:hypothetical protein
MLSFKYFMFYMFLIFIFSALLLMYIFHVFKIKILFETLENIDPDTPSLSKPPPPGYKGLSLTILQSTVPSGSPHQ